MTKKKSTDISKEGGIKTHILEYHTLIDSRNFERRKKNQKLEGLLKV